MFVLETISNKHFQMRVRWQRDLGEKEMDSQCDQFSYLCSYSFYRNSLTFTVLYVGWQVVGGNC